MGGKQFSFFLGPADQIRFEEALRSSGEIAFLKVWPTSAHPEEQPTSRVLAMGSEILDLWIARREDLSQIEFRQVKGRDVFSCDLTFAPVVEFGRCYVTDLYIRAGRLYWVDEYWDESGN